MDSSAKTLSVITDDYAEPALELPAAWPLGLNAEACA